MKAWVLHDIGDIRWENVNDPRIGNREVLVAVRAAGICGSDIPRVYQTGAHRMPLIPGHEFSGVVEAVGSGVSDSWRGQRVGIFPLIPCGKCIPCQRKQYEMCRSYGYIGSRRDGGFAEYVAVPEWNLLKLPDTVTYEEAAMLEPMAVAVHAMRQAVFTDASTVVVCGLGSIGLLLLMFLLDREKEASIGENPASGDASYRSLPRKILAIGNKDYQRQIVHKLGLPEFCFYDSRRDDAGKWLEEQTEGKGADIFFECVGKNETFSQAVFHTASAGQVVLIGNPSSDMHLDKATYWKILRNQLVIKGTWNSFFAHEAEDDWRYVLNRLQKKKIVSSELISHRFSLEDLERGLMMMRDKTEAYGKVMAYVC